MQNSHLYLIPLFRKEIIAAFNMERTEFWRKTQQLNIPMGKVSPADCIKICDILNRDVQHLIDYINQQGLKK